LLDVVEWTRRRELFGPAERALCERTNECAPAADFDRLTVDAELARRRVAISKRATRERQRCFAADEHRDAMAEGTHGEPARDRVRLGELGAGDARQVGERVRGHHERDAIIHQFRNPATRRPPRSINVDDDRSSARPRTGATTITANDPG
jgi:hypothetical protein